MPWHWGQSSPSLREGIFKYLILLRGLSSMHAVCSTPCCDHALSEECNVSSILLACKLHTSVRNQRYAAVSTKLCQNSSRCSGPKYIGRSSYLSSNSIRAGQNKHLAMLKYKSLGSRNDSNLKRWDLMHLQLQRSSVVRMGRTQTLECHTVDVLWLDYSNSASWIHFFNYI